MRPIGTLIFLQEIGTCTIAFVHGSAKVSEGNYTPKPISCITGFPVGCGRMNRCELVEYSDLMILGK